MKVQIVSFHCILKDKMGKVISSTFNQDVITVMEGQGDLLKGLVEGLQNLTKGEKRKISLKAEQAYGFYDPALVMEVSRKKLSQGATLQPGHQVMSRAEDGRPRMFRVTEVFTEAVTLDGNHPLAGQDLTFYIEATEARDATSEEIEESGSKPLAHLLH